MAALDSLVRPVAECRDGCGVYLQNYVSSAIQVFFTHLAISPPVVSSFSKPGQCLLCPSSPLGKRKTKGWAASMGSISLKEFQVSCSW